MREFKSSYKIRSARMEELNLLADVVTLSTFRDIPWNAPYYAKLGFRPLNEYELTPGFQQLRLKEAEVGLTISERVIMHYEVLQPNNSVATNG